MKKGKIFLAKYAIHDGQLQISSFGLTCFASSRRTGTCICSFWFQFSRVSKLHTLAKVASYIYKQISKWARKKMRYAKKTSLKHPQPDVHKTFRFGSLSVFTNWTKFEGPFTNVFCTYILGPCVCLGGAIFDY